MMRRLTTDDYAVDAVTMAKALVGAWLCRRQEDGSVVRRRITETEAYCGEEDTACHAHKGRTARTDVMYASKRDQNRKWRFTLKNPMTNG
jgi:DNA-3-methyladenine glycosylase